MRPDFRTLLLATTLACVDGPTAPAALDADAPDAISFAALAPGDVLSVEIHSVGCFHDATASLRFVAREDGGVRLESDVRSNVAFQHDPLIDAWNFDPIDVDTPSLAGLDRMLAYLRAGPPDTCTTREALTFRLWRDDRVVAQEVYVDGSCTAPDAPIIVTPNDLLAEQYERWYTARREAAKRSRAVAAW